MFKIKEYLSSHSYSGLGVWKLLKCVDLALRGSYEFVVKMSAEVTVIWRFDGDQIICFEDGSLTWLLAGGLCSWPREKDTKGYVFYDSIYTRFLRITKLCRQKAFQRLPRVWNKNRNELQRGTRKLFGWWLVTVVVHQVPFSKTQTVFLKWINLRYVNCALINWLKHQSIWSTALTKLMRIITGVSQ